jgi:hypothetical protein
MNPNTYSLDEIHTTLMRLRQGATTRRKFPKELWTAIIHLTKTHSIEEVCQRLQINPIYLKRKIHQSKKTEPLEFHEVQLQGLNSGMVVIELSSNTGLSARIQGPLSCLNCLQSLFGR